MKRLLGTLLLIAGALVCGKPRELSATPITNGALTVEVPSDRMEFSSDADHVFIGTMTNNSNDTLRISFWRSQRLPKGWTTSVCFGASCYAAQVDSADDTFLPNEQRELILHVNSRMVDHADSGLVFIRVRAENGVLGDTASFTVRAVFQPGNPPIIFQKVKSDSGQVFSGNGPFLVNATFQNRSADNYKFAYHLDASLPSGWSAGLCIRDSCDDLGSTGADILYPMASLVSQTVRMKVQNTSGTPLTQPDSAVLYLTVRPIGTGNSADSMQYRFVAMLQPQSGVQSTDALPVNSLMLGSIFPNPAASNDVEFAVRSQRAAECAFVLYDEAGRVVVQSKLGSVSAGSSTRSVSVRNVQPGVYFARISDGRTLSNPVLLRIQR